MSEEFFKVSSGLKQIIGRELITDKFVAIFELVKNSFDAQATEVVIRFENIKFNHTTISIIDNGIGMTREDIINKWLFVAYSEKKTSIDYRDKISSNRFYAGSRGVGRFSCDTLGRKLKLISKTKNDEAQQLVVDWDKFETDQNDLFSKIPVELSVENFPATFESDESGTSIVISDIPEHEWERNDLLKLKTRLEKLIRPDLNRDIQEKQCKIKLDVPEELKKDEEVSKPHGKINGEIKNFIFDELNIKTTKIICAISHDGETMHTALTDRGEKIYEILEHNPFALLRDVTLTLYFLNQSAKATFTRKIGIRPVEYGNIFVYKNGFRIYPFGERGDDTLGIDNRALQGYNRFLALRNLIGQIDIRGNNPELKESTSRDAGLIKTKTFFQLADISPYKTSMLHGTLTKLEKYAVDITSWGINKDDFTFDKDKESIKKLIASIANISKENDCINIDYDKDIINKLTLEENTVQKTITDLKSIAHKTEDKNLYKKITKIEKSVKKLATDFYHADQLLTKKDQENEQLSAKLDRQERENLFVKTSISTDSKELQSIQHHINRSAAQNIPLYIDKLTKAIENNSQKEQVFELIGKISLENKKIIALSQFVTKANFDTMTAYIRDDIVQFINQYAKNVYLEYKHLLFNNQKINISISNPNNLVHKVEFRPIEIVIIFDNLLNNSYKAGASLVELVWQTDTNNNIQIVVKDNGEGIQKEFMDKIYDFRFSTTDGSGLGLYHVKEVIEKMGGHIKADNNSSKGASFILGFGK